MIGRLTGHSHLVRWTPESLLNPGLDSPPLRLAAHSTLVAALLHHNQNYKFSSSKPRQHLRALDLCHLLFICRLSPLRLRLSCFTLARRLAAVFRVRVALSSERYLLSTSSVSCASARRLSLFCPSLISLGTLRYNHAQGHNTFCSSLSSARPAADCAAQAQPGLSLSSARVRLPHDFHTLGLPPMPQTQNEVVSLFVAAGIPF